jgi:hypothetical protein
VTDGKVVPLGKLRAGSHRAYRPIRNGIDILLSVLGFPSPWSSWRRIAEGGVGKVVKRGEALIFA